MTCYCESTTSKNKPCRMKVSAKGMKCRFHRHYETPSECAVCLETMSEYTTLKCGHMYHPRCIQKWLNQSMTCPMCRCEIKDRRTLRWLSGMNENDESVEWHPEVDIELHTLPPRQRRRRIARLNSIRHRVHEENSILDAVFDLYDRLFNVSEEL